MLAVFPLPRDVHRVRAAADQLLAAACSSGTRFASLLIVTCSGLGVKVRQLGWAAV